MDPKLSNLDPKLREAYERVMNGPSTPPQPAAPTTQTQPNAASFQNPVPPPAMPAPSPVVPTQTPQTQPPLPDPSPAINTTIAYNAHNSSVNKGTDSPKKSGGMKVLLLGVVILAFLVIYTFVWVFLFHLKLPFLP